MNAGDTDEDDTMFQPAKRAKKATLYQPLRRTGKLVNHIKGELAKRTLETTLEAMLTDSEPDEGWAMSEDHDHGSNEVIEIDDEGELTPRPRTNEGQDGPGDGSESSSADDDKPFKTPLALKQQRRMVVDSDDNLEEQEKEGTKQKDKKTAVSNRIANNKV
jgi:hypothetical protein